MEGLIQPLPWTVRLDGDTLASVIDAQGFAVFGGVTEAEAKFIVTRCNGASGAPSVTDPQSPGFQPFPSTATNWTDSEPGIEAVQPVDTSQVGAPREE